MINVIGAQFIFSKLIGFIRPYTDHRVLAIGMIAYANAIPALLTASTLAIWLKEYGLSYSAIGLFSLVHLPYNFKFLWAPILDQARLPILGNIMGQRRSWLFLLQLICILCLLWMAQLNPGENLMGFITLSVLTSVAAASQHVLLLAYQVQTLESREWGVGEGMSVFGFRMGLLSSGAGALYLATILPWSWVYTVLAGVMALALLVVLLIPEPQVLHEGEYSKEDCLKDRIAAWFRNIFLKAYKDFTQRNGWVWLLVFMMLYRLPDHLLGPLPSLFLLDIGYSKAEIATVSKVFGLITTILGGLVGGLLLREWSFHKTLLFAGIFHGFSMLGFLFLNQTGYDMPTLYSIMALEHFSSGLGLTAFFSYQMSQCNPKFAATQLAIMTAAAALGHRLGGLAGGVLVDWLSWGGFFIIVCLSTIPGILMASGLTRTIPAKDDKWELDTITT